MNKLLSVVEGLECLELSSVGDTDSGYANVADDETAETFRLLIEHAERLKVLRVALSHHIKQQRYEARMSDEYRGALQACTSTELQELRLSEVWMREAQVIKLLEKHQRSLRKLNFSYFFLEGEIRMKRKTDGGIERVRDFLLGSWKNVLTWILKNLSLDYLVLKSLRVYELPEDGHIGAVKAGIENEELTNAEAVQEGLKSLIWEQTRVEQEVAEWISGPWVDFGIHKLGERWQERYKRIHEHET